MRLSSGLWIMACALTVLAGGASAGEGDLEPGFGSPLVPGKVRIAFDQGGTKADHVVDMVLQPNGWPVMLGTVDIGVEEVIGLARMRHDGLADPAFNGDGNADGEIVQGTLGSVEPRALVVQTDGRIVIAGLFNDGRGTLMRRDAAGARFDFPGADSFLGINIFAIPGASSTAFTDLLALPAGKFLAAGTVTTNNNADFFVARFNADGSPDTGFGVSAGYTRIAFNLDLASNDRAAAVAVAGDGRIAVVGTVSESDNEYGVAMLQPGGTPDPTFDGDGKTVENFDIGVISNDRAAAACFAPDGSLLVGGTVTDSVLGNVVGLMLLTNTGSLVEGFGSSGRRTFAVLSNTELADVACTADGKFIAMGTVASSQADLAREGFATRFLSNGSNDSPYGTTAGTVFFGLNRPTAPPPTGRDDNGVAMALRADGGVYAAFDAEFDDPDFDFGLARLEGTKLFEDGFE